MKKRNLLFSLVLLTAFTACQKKYKCKSFNSQIISESVSVSEFDKINLKTDADIYYTQGTEQSVVIEAPEELLKHISASVFQNTLKIDTEHNFCFNNKKTVKIYIQTPDLLEVDIEGSGDIKLENNLTTENFTVNVSGSGDFYADSISVENFTTSISGSGDIYAAGTDTITNQTIKIGGSGDIDLLNIPSRETDIKISGSGSCLVNTLDKLTVKISGSGEVRYRGNPVVNSDISGSGSVKQY